MPDWYMLTIFHLVFSLSLTDFSYISLKDELQPCLFLVLLFPNLHQLYLFETQACQAAVNGQGLTWITNSLSFFKIKGTFTTDDSFSQDARSSWKFYKFSRRYHIFWKQHHDSKSVYILQGYKYQLTSQANSTSVNVTLLLTCSRHISSCLFPTIPRIHNCSGVLLADVEMGCAFHPAANRCSSSSALGWITYCKDHRWIGFSKSKYPLISR